MADGSGGADEDIEAALIETHHLANLSGLREAELARKRLVEAQSAAGRRRTRDLLVDAREYLELARLQRRDCAPGFTEARDLAAAAEAALGHERPLPSRLPAGLFRPSPRRGRSLAALRREAAVSSYEQLRYDLALEEVFAEIRRQVRAETDEAGAGARAEAGTGGTGGAEETGPDADGRDLAPEEALRLAGLEVDIERAVMNARPAEADFEFLSPDQLVAPEAAAAEEPGDAAAEE